MMETHKTRPVIDARHLTRIFRLGDSEVIGINDIGLNVAPGELVVLKGNPFISHRRSGSSHPGVSECFGS